MELGLGWLGEFRLRIGGKVPLCPLCQAERELADAARARHRARQLRVVREDEQRTSLQAETQASATSADAVAAALARARAKRGHRGETP